MEASVYAAKSITILMMPMVNASKRLVQGRTFLSQQVDAALARSTSVQTQRGENAFRMEAALLESARMSKASARPVQPTRTQMLAPISASVTEQAAQRSKF